MTEALHYPAAHEGRERVLLVMLPGVGFEAAAFAEHGMVEAVQAHGVARGLAVDVVAARPELELYLGGDVAAALHDSVVGPARGRGYRRVWLLGVSLGGMGALLYARAHEAELAGLVLLAPFLGTQGTVAEMAKAGGLAGWSPDRSAATDAERDMLVWLREYVARDAGEPALYLGYGLEDRFAVGHRLLAERLPENRVFTAAGGHDWQAWGALWRDVLACRPFTRGAGHG